MANSTQEILDQLNTVNDRMDDLESRIYQLSTEAAMRTDLDGVWIIISAVIVFFMQVGFAMVSFESVC